MNMSAKFDDHGLMEGTGTLLYYLVNRVLTKNEGPHGKKLHENQEIAVERAVGVWVHRDSGLGAQMGSVLEPNTNAQRMLFLSHLLRSAVFACVRDCYSLLRIL